MICRCIYHDCGDSDHVSKCGLSEDLPMHLFPVLIIDCALDTKILRINGLSQAFLFHLKMRTAWVYA